MKCATEGCTAPVAVAVAWAPGHVLLACRECGERWKRWGFHVVDNPPPPTGTKP